MRSCNFLPKRSLCNTCLLTKTVLWNLQQYRERFIFAQTSISYYCTSSTFAYRHLIYPRTGRFWNCDLGLVSIGRSARTKYNVWILFVKMISLFENFHFLPYGCYVKYDSRHWFKCFTLSINIGYFLRDYLQKILLPLCIR